MTRDNKKDSDDHGVLSEENRDNEESEIGIPKFDDEDKQKERKSKPKYLIRNPQD